MTITDAQGSLEELRERFVPSPYLQHHPIFVAAGEGSWITDLSGTRYLDLTGVSRCST
jgi:4-aminobutyrate aminotransferase-like enzyme